MAEEMKICLDCPNPVTSPNKRYCPACAERRTRESKAKYQKRTRTKQKAQRAYERASEENNEAVEIKRMKDRTRELKANTAELLNRPTEEQTLRKQLRQAHNDSIDETRWRNQMQRDYDILLRRFEEAEKTIEQLKKRVVPNTAQIIEKDGRKICLFYVK